MIIDRTCFRVFDFQTNNSNDDTNGDLLSRARSELEVKAEVIETDSLVQRSSTCLSPQVTGGFLTFASSYLKRSFP